MRFGKEERKRRKVIPGHLRNCILFSMTDWRIYFELGSGDR